MTFLRILVLACTLAAGLVSVSAAPALGSGLQTDRRAAPDALGFGSFVEDRPGVVRQAYDLLLDRFVAPLSPPELLGPAIESALKAAAEAKPGEWSGPAPAFEGSREEDWSTFAAWFDTLVALAEPELERSALEEAAIRAMVAAVKETHTRYLTPSQHRDYQAWARGDVRYAGIGARLRGPTPTVVEVFDDSPAAQAGLQPGDVILEIDGLSTEGATLEATIGRIRGPEGTPTELLLRRPGLEEPLRLTVTRAEIRIVFVRWRRLDQGIGYIQLRGFPEASVVDEVSRALAAFDQAGVDGLILDLRGNSGGRLDVGVRVASRFVRDGTLYQQVDRSGRRRSASPTGDYWERSVPIVALVDGGTASMGEILASALQEAGAAHLVGVTTSGNVAAAQLFPLGDGSAMQITVLEIMSGQGARLNGVGVRPDEVVELADDQLQRGRDPQLEAALAYLQRSQSVPIPPPAIGPGAPARAA